MAEARESVLHQGYPEKEVIVINDGSTDGTLDVLRGFGDAIRVIDQKNSGPPAARNAGLRAVRGEYIAFLDADDVWVPGKLARQIEHLDSRPEVGAVFTEWKVWEPDADGAFRRPAWFAGGMADAEIDLALSGWLYNKLLFECEMLTSSVMLRVSVVRAVGEFDLGMFNGDDYDYWLRVSRVTRISKLRCAGVLYRVLPDSVSRKARVTNYEYEVIRSALARWGRVGPDGTETGARQMQDRLDRLAHQHGYAHLLHGDPQIALDTFRELLARHPLRPQLWLQFARALIKTSGAPVRGGWR